MEGSLAADYSRLPRGFNADGHRPVVTAAEAGSTFAVLVSFQVIRSNTVRSRRDTLLSLDSPGLEREESPMIRRLICQLGAVLLTLLVLQASTAEAQA